LFRLPVLPADPSGSGPGKDEVVSESLATLPDSVGFRDVGIHQPPGEDCFARGRMASIASPEEPHFMPQSTVHCLCRLVLAAIFAGFAAGDAAALTLKPWKDELFGYPAVVETTDNGALRFVDYQEMRDINGDRRLGNNDWNFGGNFNRLKNLTVQNGGVYYAPSVPSFDDAGAARISGLILRAKALSPDRPVILACASMGSFICARVVRDATAVRSLSGMVLMGGAADGDYAKTPAFKAKLPVFFTHGDSDGVYAANDQIAVLRKLLKAGIPTRFVLFQTGGHGTPVRMTDWRETLNWLFAQ